MPKPTFVPLNSDKDSGEWALTIGNFDGIHLGHQELLKRVIEYGKKNNLKKGIITFDPYPKEVLSKESPPARIYSEHQKLKVLSQWKLDGCFIFNFDERFSILTAEEFLRDILLANFKLKKIVTGSDFRFGKNRSGDTQLLEKQMAAFDIDYEVVPPITKNGQIVSSSLIRKLIQANDFQQAALYLDRDWSLKSMVTAGEKRASTIGFPTANLIHSFQLPLTHGVYGVEAKLNDSVFYGVMNYGKRPTFSENFVLAEVHLFDFHQDIYGQELEVFPRFFIRKEKKFSSIEELKQNIQADVQQTRKQFAMPDKSIL